MSLDLGNLVDRYIQIACMHIFSYNVERVTRNTNL
jgi:hypothetical protein